LEGVIDPWSWPRAKGASDDERALEDIGPYETFEGGEVASPNARYWTTSVGIAWTRDIDLDLDGEPVDLDGDGVPDTKVTRHIHAKGGVLANPKLFGLTPTSYDDDPRAQIGRISASTGVVGLRESLRPGGRRSGEIGMTCWLCHASYDPVAEGATLGLAAVHFDYGLLLATARALDDDHAAARAARGFPSGRTVRARLLLAGPGRQDLTGEFGLDVTVPFHSARYAGTRRVRQGTKGVFNPISVPSILATLGLRLQNWSGSEDADAPHLARLVALAKQPTDEVVDAFGLYGSWRELQDPALSRRALMLDLRNLGTLGLQQDSFPGLLWADAIYGRVELSPEALARIPPMYATVAVRRALGAAVRQLGADATSRDGARSEKDDARVARGRAIFTERVVGEIVNRQILKHAPHALAAARLEGPILAPIDPTRPLDAKLPVRCADCHNAAPLDYPDHLSRGPEDPPPLGRCSHCHVAHPALARDAPGRKIAGDAERLVALTALATPRAAAAEVAFCSSCHGPHRAFGPPVYSNSRLFPFDADGDGDAQGNPAADARAGGIGTEPLLAFDVPRPERPFALDLPVVGADPAASTRVTRARVGVAWVRTAPLFAVGASAPYLHNGSVPTLRALLEPAPRRPVTFPLGAAGFVFDTRLPGNRNMGHEYGTKLTRAQKDDLMAFLETL
jgi:hypothetical protein